MGPFHSTVPAEAMASCILGGAVRPDVQTLPPVGDVGADGADLAARAGRSRTPPRARGPRCRSEGGWACPWPEQCGALADAVPIDQRTADVVPCGGQERERHAAAHDERVDPGAVRPSAPRACRPPWRRPPRPRTAASEPRAAPRGPRSPVAGGIRRHWAGRLGGPTTEACAGGTPRRRRSRRRRDR